MLNNECFRGPMLAVRRRPVCSDSEPEIEGNQSINQSINKTNCKDDLKL